MSSTAISKGAFPNYRWVMLAINTWMLIVVSMGLTSWSVAVPPLRKAFDLGTFAVMLGASLFVLGYTIGSGVYGELISIIGFKWTGLLGLGCIVAAQALIPYLSNWYAILFMRFVMGWGLIVVPISYITGIWFPETERAMSQGVLIGGLTAGFAVGGAWTGYLEPIIGWQRTFSYLAILMVASAILWAYLTRKPPERIAEGTEEELEENESTDTETSNSSDDQRNIYKHPVTWLLSLCIFANFFQIYGMQSVAGAYLYTVGFSTTDVGTLVFGMGIIGLFSTPLGGIVSDRVVARSDLSTPAVRAYVQMLGGFLVSTIGSFIEPLLAPIGFGLAMAGLVTAGWGIPWTNGSTYSIPIDVFGEERGDRVIGAMMLIGGAGGVISPLFVTWLAQVFSWTIGWFALGIGSAIGIVASIGIILYAR